MQADHPYSPMGMLIEPSESGSLHMALGDALIRSSLTAPLPDNLLEPLWDSESGELPATPLKGPVTFLLTHGLLAHKAMCTAPGMLLCAHPCSMRSLLHRRIPHLSVLQIRGAMTGQPARAAWLTMPPQTQRSWTKAKEMPGSSL